MRLAIDPFPILLMEEDVLYRCYDSITDPYSVAFVDEYIGKESLETYKKTAIYTGMREFFMSFERKNDAVFNIVKNQYINSQCKDDILSQVHLLGEPDVISAMVVFACPKIVNVYLDDFWHWYYTDRPSNRKNLSWSSTIISELVRSDNKINQVLDEVFMSVFLFNEVYYLLEHNKMLDDNDLTQIVKALDDARLYLRQ